MDKNRLKELEDAEPSLAIAGAVEGTTSDDRNDRVAACRILNHTMATKTMDDVLLDQATLGVLTGLRDSASRVQIAALKCCWPLLSRPEIVSAMEAIIVDPLKKRKTRAQAVLCLFTGPDTPIKLVQELLSQDQWRKLVLTGLLSTDLFPGIETILKELSESGNLREVEGARRCLAGQQIVNLAAFEPRRRKKIARESEVWEGVWIWTDRTTRQPLPRR